jgi:nucleotide-binding universal stress UspA family protein
MKILLAVDGSGHSEAAVHEVASRPLPAHSEVRIISVHETTYFPPVLPGEGMSGGLYLDIEARARAQAQTAVARAAATLRAGDTCDHRTVTTGVPAGSAKRLIIEEAEAFGADLIVVGSHGHGHFERFLLGSVSQAVALHATCSVEIVRSPKTRTGAQPAR